MAVLEEAESAFWRGEYDVARDGWLEVLRAADPIGDVDLKATVRTWLGHTARQQGDYPEARFQGDSALSIKWRHELGPGRLATGYNALGLLAWEEGRLADAEELFTRSLGEARRAGEPAAIARASGNLALIQADLGQFAAARRGFRTLYDAGRELENVRYQANALTNLGMLEIRVGDALAALPALRDARRLFAELGSAAEEQNTLAQLATAYAALGEMRPAFAALDSALALSRRHGLRAEEAENLLLVADLYRGVGDLARALDYYERAEVLHRELGMEAGLANTLRSEAAVHVALGHLDRALARAAEALEIHSRLNARSDMFSALLLSAEINHAAGRGERAARYLARADRLAQELDARRARAQLALTRARLADRDGRAVAVLHALDRGAPDLEQGDYGLEWEAHALRARALARLGRLDEAARAGRRAVATVERVRQTIGSGVLRTTYAAERATAYADLVAALLALGETEEGLVVADAARGRALLENLGAGRVAEAESRPPAADLAEGEALLRRIDELVLRLDELDEIPPAERDVSDAAQAALLAEHLARARSEYESLLIRTAEGDDRAHAMLGGAPLRPRDLQRVLRPDEALLEYLVTKDRVIVFVVTRATIGVASTPIGRDRLAARVRLARDLLAGGAGDGAGSVADAGHTTASAEVLSSLFDVLFGPALPELNAIARLIIVPHGPLTYLPFAGLRDADRGRSVAEEYAVTVLPSAAALPALRSVERQTATNRQPTRAIAFAPFPDALPASRLEARAVGRSLRRGRSVLGRRASETAVRSALAAGGVVHIASHGILNARNPSFSRIELARGREPGPANDGRLEVHELLRMRVRSPLVFLSGCETGLGTAGLTGFAPAEDYTTLAQAFLFAGARNVVATLWRVEDEGAAAFAAAFYAELETLPPPEALAAAQRRMMTHPRFAAPYYWAAYQISGDGEALTPAQNRALASVTP